MTRFFIVPALALSIVACTPEQLVTANRYQEQIAGACQMAMMLAPMAGAMAPWIIGGCATEREVARLALDPTSLTWLKGLLAKM